MELDAEDVCQRLEELFDRLTKGMSGEEYADACNEVRIAFNGRHANALKDLEHAAKKGKD